MGIKVSAVNTEMREWIPKNVCGLESEGSAEPGGVEKAGIRRLGIENQAQETTGWRGQDRSITECPVALHHRGLQVSGGDLLLLLSGDRGGGGGWRQFLAPCWVDIQVSRPKVQALILVCSLLTKASGLLIKPPTEVTIGQMANTF